MVYFIGVIWKRGFTFIEVLKEENIFTLRTLLFNKAFIFFYIFSIFRMIDFFW